MDVGTPFPDVEGVDEGTAYASPEILEMVAVGRCSADLEGTGRE